MFYLYDGVKNLNKFDAYEYLKDHAPLPIYFIDYLVKTKGMEDAYLLENKENPCNLEKGF